MFSYFHRNKKTRKSRSAAQTRRFIRRLPLSLELLESRVLLSADNWIGGSGNWDTGSNWSLGNAPGTSDTAVINTSSAATITIKSGDNINIQSITTGSNDTLSIAGGLIVTSGSSTLSGVLTMSGGSLQATGIGVSLKVNGATTVADASLYAENGATLSLPQMTSYTADGNTFEANGANSVLDVSALTTPTIRGSWSINAYNGGTLKLMGLTSLSSSSEGSIYINDTGGSTLLDGNVSTLNGVIVTLDGTDAKVANTWTKFTAGQLNVTGGSYILSGLTDVDDSNVHVSNGGSLALPGVTKYESNGTYFQADGTGSVLDVSALTALTQKNNWSINAYNGGTLKLTGMTALNGSNGGIYINDTGGSTLLDGNVTVLSDTTATLDGTDTTVANTWTKFTASQLNVTGGAYTLNGLTDVDDSNVHVSNGGSLALPGVTRYDSNGTYFQADGTGSVLDVSALTALTQKNNWSINAYNGGTLKLTGMTALNGSNGGIFINDAGGSTLLDGNVTIISDATATLDGTDTKVANTWTKFTGSQLNVTGGSYNLSSLTDVDDSNVHVSNGGSLALPGVTRYDSNGTYFQADGTGSVLDVSALTALTQKNNWSINAYNGGTLKLTGMTALNGSNGGIYINDTGGSTLLDGNVTILSDTTATLDGTDAKVANTWTKFTASQLNVTGGTYTLNGLTDVDDSNVHVSNGGSLALPGVTKYESNGTYFQADGTGSVLDVSALTTLTQKQNWSINAYNGGTVKLSGLTSLASTQGIYFNVDGSGSTLDLPALTSITGQSNFSLTHGAALSLPVLTAGNITLGNGSQITIQGTVVGLPADGTSGATINVPSSKGLTITLDNSGTQGLSDTTFKVGAGTTLALASGTYLGNTTFNVAQGATVDLSGGQRTTYGGTLTGTGAGTVAFSSGGINTDGMLTLNFTGNMFQWTGGAFFASVGDVTNNGTMNLAGSNDKGFYEDATLFNAGTIIQTGTGNLGLHSDNVSPTTLDNETGASYLIEDDGGFDNPYGGQVAVINAGTLKKTGGTGTSTLNINGTLSNTGTIEADSGTLLMAPNTFTQISNGTLTAGTWNAINGASLLWGPTTAGEVTNNAASVTISGSGADSNASFNLFNLSTNSGSFTISNGFNDSQTANFTNSGSFTVGAGSTFSFGGTFTQTAAGSLNVQIGGTPASGQFGQVAVTGAATLGGALNVSLVNGFTPSSGQDFKTMTYASASGSFATVTGLGSSLTETVNPTSLDLTTTGTAAVDLGLTSVAAPIAATTGQPITVSWTVNNSSTTAAVGSWQDSVFLSTTAAITGSSILLGSLTHTGGLAANGSYNATLTAAMPALPPGNYYVLVQADSLYQVPVTSRANDILAASTGPVAVSVPALTLGTPINGTFTAANQDQYYQVTVPAGGALQVSLTSAAPSGALALYVSQFTQPTPYSYQVAANANNQPNQTLTVPQVFTAGTYYILVHSVSGAAATANYTLTATQSSALSVTGISTATAGNGGNATVEIDGSNFLPTATASLTRSGTTITASSVYMASASQIFATFNLTGAALGSYTLSVQQGSQSATAATQFQVVAATTGNPLQLVLNTPSMVRAFRTGVVSVTVTNTSNNDLAAPLLTLSADGALLKLPSEPGFEDSSLAFLAASPSGRAGVLTAGETVTFTIDFQSNTTNPTINFELNPTDTTQPYVWSTVASLVSELNATLPNASAALTYMQNEVGPTWGDYIAMLDRNANLIPPQLGSASDINALFRIELDKTLAAVSTSIAGTLETSQPGVNVAGQTVYATDTNSGTVYATTALNDGSFYFSNLAASTYTFSVDGLSLTSSPTVTVNSGQAFTGVALAATEGSQILGQVLAQGTGTPIVGAAIEATNESSGDSFDVTADDNGNYLLAGLPSGIYDLVIDATGYARVVITGIDVSTTNAIETVTMTTESSVNGTVVLANGGPGASSLAIVAQPSGSNDNNQLYSTESDTSTYTLGGLPANTYDVTVSMDGYLPMVFTGVIVPSGQSIALGSVTLTPASEIDGTITSTASNFDVSGLVVQALQGNTIVGAALTDSSGNFQITNLPAGTYTLILPDASGVYVSATPVTVAAGQTVTNAAIEVQSGGTISGTVDQSTTNAPIAGIPVNLSGPGGLSEDTRTDSNGNYSFSGLGTGEYQVYLAIGGSQTSQTVSVAKLDGTVVTADLQLGYVGVIKGNLMDNSGNPITDGMITLFEGGEIVATATTDTSGSYQLLVMQPGTYDLSAFAPEGTFAVANNLVVNTGSVITQNFETGSATLTVSVTDGSQSVAGAVVELEGVVEGNLIPLTQTTVDSSGTASFANLSPGKYTIVAFNPNGDSGQTPISIAAGSSNNATIPLAAQATLSGTVTDSAGNPLSGATVIVQSAGNLQQGYAAVTLDDGTYIIPGIPPGTYDVTVFADNYQAVTQTAVKLSTATTLNQALAASTTSITGKVTDVANNVVPDGIVTVSDAAGHILGSTEVQSDGSFQVTSAMGANLILNVSAPGYLPFSSDAFNAPAGSNVPLQPVLSKPVAIDPSASSKAASNAVLLPQDSLHVVDVIKQQAAKLAQGVQKVSAGSNSCPKCNDAFAAVKKAASKVNDAAQKVVDRKAKIYAIGSQVNATYTAFSNVINTIGDALRGVADFLHQQGVDIPQLDDIRVLFNKTRNDVSSAAQAGDYIGLVGKLILVNNDLAEMGKLATGAISIDLSEGLGPILGPIVGSALSNALGLVAKSAVKAAQLDNQVSDQVQQMDSQLTQLRASRKEYDKDLAAFKKAQDALNTCQTTKCCNGASSSAATAAAVEPDDGGDTCPAKPPGKPGPTGSTPNQTSHDPNALIGPAGYGTQGFILPRTGALPYTVDFENDGTAAAQTVIVTQQFDANLDWSTFQLGSFGFGSVNLAIPAGLTQYQTTVAYQNADGTALNVKVSLNFNVQTGLLTVAFTSIDPTTGQTPTGVLDGFLPPDNSSGIGEGYVQYTVQTKSGLASGTAISGQASVVFDTNAAIQTQTVTNTIDAALPASSVNPLPATVNSPNFAVSWSGSDPGGPGIASFNVYVSDNGGSFTPWLTNTTQTSATYSGQVGHHYSFYSVASDALGLTQPTPIGTQSTTYVFVPPSPPPPPPPHQPPSLQIPPLLALFNSLLGGVETINSNGTETITDSIFGIPLIVANFDGTGKLMDVTLFGIDVTFLFELL